VNARLQGDAYSHAGNVSTTITTCQTGQPWYDCGRKHLHAPPPWLLKHDAFVNDKILPIFVLIFSETNRFQESLYVRACMCVYVRTCMRACEGVQMSRCEIVHCVLAWHDHLTYSDLPRHACGRGAASERGLKILREAQGVRICAPVWALVPAAHSHVHMNLYPTLTHFDRQGGRTW